MAEIVQRCEEAISLGLKWLAGRVSDKGELEGSESILFGYYKALLTFTATGRYLEAGRVAHKIKRDFYKDGQFGGEQYPAATVGPIYRDSWLTWGAHLAGRYDMSVPAANAIRSQLCGITGGVLVDGPGRIIDAGLTCCALTALLAAGKSDEVMKGAELVRALVEDQPEPEEAFYFRWSPETGYIKPAVGEDGKGWTVRRTDSGQIYWYIGYLLALMAQMNLLTGERKWINAAEKLLAFVNGCLPEIFGSTSNGKIAWGCAELFAVTGDERFRDVAARMTEWICDVQAADGRWYRSPDQSIPVAFDATFERVFYLSRIARALQP
ncbi:apramycin biosynthesis protein [Sphingobium chlorophenolicum]|uniref:Putative apramycin biosynthesis protein n=1 Tax=Sphingobium chlorophenolicum TaxID=46429 RepID=A0A081RJP4_SPHCR|nr:apramycin biosynthesis protein [Sphingobium chlorophenolicum]KEQ55417.1 putative apramycin biosynthesis protein [Sphingobium chlorophenolicum]